MELIGLVGQSHGRWAERRAILSQMLALTSHEKDVATGFVACTVPRTTGNAPRLIYDRAMLPAGAFIVQSLRWRSLRRCGAVLAYVRDIEPSDTSISIPPFVSADRKWAAIENGIVVPSDLSSQNNVNGSVLLSLRDDHDKALQIVEMLDSGVAPMTAAVFDLTLERLHVGRIGQPLCLCRWRGDACWFLAPSIDLFHEAVRTVVGPQSPIVEAAIPVADGTLLTLMTDGVVFVQTPYRTKYSGSDPIDGPAQNGTQL